MSLVLNEFCCIFCNLNLNGIFIKCETCALQNRLFACICLECFASGNESVRHRNDHAYRVLNASQIETHGNWTLLDELQLLNKLGTGNENVFFKRTASEPSQTATARIGPFDHEQCVKHVEDWSEIFKTSSSSNDKHVYDEMKIYTNRLKSTLVTFKDLSGNDFQNLPSHNNKLGACNLSLIRPPIHSKQYRLMNGYRPARGDFETELNEKFEFKHIADMDYESTPIEFSREDREISEETDGSSSEAELDFDEMCSVETSLKLSVLNSYTDLIRERYERKRLVKKLGLLNELAQNEYALTLLMNKNSQLKQMENNFMPKNLPSDSMIENNSTHLYRLNNDLVKFLLPVKFQRLFGSLDKFMQCVGLFSHQTYLRRKLADLSEYRANGLSSLKHAHVYKSLKQKRLNRVPSVHLSSLLTLINRYDDNASVYYCKNLCQDWFKKFVLSDKSYTRVTDFVAAASSPDVSNCLLSNFTTSIETSPATPPPPSLPVNPSAYPASHLKYKNNPLKIENYPECEKLNEDEKEFCRVARVQPSVYLRVKAILVLENKKAGFCSYARARKIAGIDVNKTRLIHNLMLKLEYVRASAAKEELID